MLQHLAQVEVIEDESADRERDDQEHRRMVQPLDPRLRPDRLEAHLDLAPALLARVDRHDHVRERRFALGRRDPVLVVIAALHDELAVLAPDADRQDLAALGDRGVDGALDRALVLGFDEGGELDREARRDPLAHLAGVLDLVRKQAEREVEDQHQEDGERDEPERDAADCAYSAHAEVLLRRDAEKTQAAPRDAADPRTRERVEHSKRSFHCQCLLRKHQNSTRR